MVCMVIGTGHIGTCTLADSASRTLPKTAQAAACISPPRGATVASSEAGRPGAVVSSDMGGLSLRVS